MKKSDALTGIGLLLGIGMMIYGMMLGSSLMIFWDLSSVLITVGGSLSAVLITVPLDQMKKIGKVFIQAFKESSYSEQNVITQFSELSKKARREGLLSLEDEISTL